MARTYRVTLTGPQLRVLHETLSVVLNDPDWIKTIGSDPHDFRTLANADETITDALRTAWRTESTPATNRES